MPESIYKAAATVRGSKRAIVGGLIGVATIAGAASSHVADATMTEDYSARVAYACNKVHALSAPYRECTVTWVEALRYETRKLRRRLPNPGPPCGDEQTVYQATLRADLWGLGPEKARDTADIIVRDSTQAGFIHGKPSLDRAELFEALQGLRNETLADYYLRNAHPVELRSLDSLPGVEVLSPARADSITQLARRGGDPYAFLYSRYPHAGGMVGMSRPGMSRDGRQALVEVGWSKAPLHGGGRLLLLACRSGKWTLLDWFQTWVS